MKVAVVVLAALLGVAFATVPRVPIFRNGELIPNQYMFVFNNDVSVQAAKAFTAAIGGERFMHIGKSFKFFSGVFRDEVIERLAERTDLFQFIEQDQVVRTFGTQRNATWGLDRIDQRNLPLDSTYNYKDIAGSGAYAYVIDTGILNTHNDFGGRSVSGYNFHDGTSDATDDNGHGTHCSGTVGGTTYGVAKRVNLVGVKVLGRLGSGSLSNVAAGVAWAADAARNQAAVANMSLGGSTSAVIDNAVNAAQAAGLPVVAASGNSNADACNFSPARSAILSVNAADRTDNKASFSNYGTCTDIFAPGVDVTSTYIGSNSATSTLSGTSMASPHVAGAVAILQSEGKKSPQVLASTITSNATPNLIPAPRGSPNLLLYSPY